MEERPDAPHRGAPAGPAAPARAHHVAVTRTARYFTAGTGTDEVWFVLHGYGQRAAAFIEPFAAHAGPRRLVVAPEALSRFYLDRRSRHVGATWMTREDREHEIDDYVAYLETVRRTVADAGDEVHVLGFSQGCETAARWVAYGDVAPRSLILWGGVVPPDLDLDAHRDAFTALRLLLVAGTADAWATPERVASLRERLDAHRIPHATRTFDGGHRIDPAVLREVFGDGGE